MEPENSTSINEEETLEALQEQLETLEREAAELERKKDEVLDDLGTKITSEYNARRTRRGSKEQQWLLAMRLRLGNLSVTRGFSSDPDRPFDVPGSYVSPERNIVYTKSELAKAQLYSMQFSGGEKNWDILPPENVTELAAMGITDITDRCERMETAIAEALENGHFEREYLKVIDEYVDLGTGILKGPTNTAKMYKTYEAVETPGGRIWVPKVVPRPEGCLKQVSCWFCLPDDRTNDFNQAEDVIEVHPMSKNELFDLTKNPGFMKDKIYKAIEQGPNPGTVDSTLDFIAVSDTNPMAFRDKYTVLERHGPVTREQLDVLEISPSINMPEDKYFAEIWVVNNIIIRVELSNLEACNKPPYSAATWVKDPASPFGYGIPLLLRDSQRVVNVTWDMILTNASQASGPQIVIQEDMVQPSDGEFVLNPGKVWYFSDISGDVNKAFQFFEVPNTTNQLFPILEAARQGSEEESGIAMIAAGMQSAQTTTDTATGLAIQQKASTVLLELKSNDLDENVMEPGIQWAYDWQMQYNPDDSIKAPMRVRIRSATEYNNKQMYVRDMEKLSVEASQNPTTGEWVNTDELLKLRLGMMNLPNRGVIKSTEQVNQEREAAAQNPPPPSPDELKYQTEMAKLELEKERLAIEREKIEFERGEAMKKEQMEYEERMVNTYARIAESETELMRAQTEKEIAFLQLAAKTESEAERNAIMSQIAVMSEETKRILGGLQHTAKTRDQLLTQRELTLAETSGEGI